MRFKKFAIIISLAFILSSCSSGGITYKISDVYGDEHFQRATIAFFENSTSVPISEAEIEYLDNSCSGGGSSTTSDGYLSITTNSNRGFENPKEINLKISDIKTLNGVNLPYTFQNKISIKTFEKCHSYVADESVSTNGEFVLKKIHISPYSIAFSGSGTINRGMTVEVINSLGESFGQGNSCSDVQLSENFMFAMNFPRKIDNANITTILIEGIPYKIIPSKSDVFDDPQDIINES